MNWQAQIISLITLHFKKYGINYKPTDDAHSCLVDFMNLDLKLVKPVPRHIFKSNTLKHKVLPPQYQKALSDIESKIQTGKDITFHQSKRTLDPKYNDLLLNDWIIQHFHVSNTKSQKNQRFYDRSKYLLFAGFAQTQAFLIDVRLHSEEYVFAKKELLEIMDHNWPALFKDNLVEDGFFTNEYSDQDVHILRKKGYTIGTTKVNNKIIVNPGLGITSSGHNIHVVRRANSIMKMLYDTYEEICTHRENIKADISSETGIEIAKLEFEIKQVGAWPYFIFYDPSSDCYIQKHYSK